MTVQLLHGDARAMLKTLADSSVDSIVTDPPYGLEFMGKDWDAPWKSRGNPAGAGFAAGGFTDGNGYANRETPTYGKPWQNKRCTQCGHIASGGSPCTCPSPTWVIERGDTTAPMKAFQEWCEEWARECLRVLKPGGHLLSFGGSRTYHRMACAIENAGFEIRDQIMWLYGSGFPKSLDVSKAIDKAAGAEREVVGTHHRHEGGSAVSGSMSGPLGTDSELPLTAPSTDAAKQWAGWGTALKPAHEPIVVARKPLIGTVAANVLEFGTGALNIDASRVPTTDKLGGGMENGTSIVSEGWDRPWRSDPDTIERKKVEEAEKIAKAENLGRWPANVIHDGSDEVVSGFPDTESGKPGTRRKIATSDSMAGPLGLNDREEVGYGDKGSAARFFYCPKANKKDRDEGLTDLPEVPCGMMEDDNYPIKTGAGNLRNTTRKNNHPTVKPTALMRYLVKLVTPPGGTVLDPFAGSGSTGKAAKLEGFSFIGVELNEDYLNIAKARIEAA